MDKVRIFIKNNVIRFVDDSEKDIGVIPQGNWLLIFNKQRAEFVLEKQKDFILPKKVYGNEEQIVDRYLQTFKKGKNNLGILLSGQKGCGKSLTAKYLCNKSRLPVIIITEPFVGNNFHSLLSKIDQEIIIFIDEFEKTYYEEEKQQEFLPILDGVFQGKKLFIFTSNSFNINPFLKSRPGRIRYLRQYDGISDEVREQVIEDLLVDKTKKEELLYVLDIIFSVSIDVLLHLIDEMNTYKETALQAIQHLNIQIEHSLYRIVAFIKGARVQSTIHHNPLTQKYIMFQYDYVNDRGEKRLAWYENPLEDMQVQHIESDIIMYDRDNNKIICSPIKPHKFLIEGLET